MKASEAAILANTAAAKLERERKAKAEKEHKASIVREKKKRQAFRDGIPEMNR